jgi:hypothetical protein
MVKALITKDCASHRYNQSYQTLLVVFDGSDTNVRPLSMRGDWQPRDEEVLSIVKILCNISPTFAEKLIHFALTFNQWNTKPVKSKPITNLVDVLL